MICRTCERWLRDQLQDQVEHREQLRLELARQVRKSPPGRGGSVSPLVFDPEASRVLDRQESVLARWAAVCGWSRSAEDPGSVGSWSRWLVARLRSVRRRDDAPQLMDELRRLGAAIRKVIDSPANRTRIPVGPCPEEIADDEGRLTPCSGSVIAVVPADESVPATMRCEACRSEWRSDQWRRAGARIVARAGVLQRQRERAAEFLGRSVAA